MRFKSKKIKTSGIKNYNFTEIYLLLNYFMVNNSLKIHKRSSLNKYLELYERPKIICNHISRKLELILIQYNIKD